MTLRAFRPCEHEFDGTTSPSLWRKGCHKPGKCTKTVQPLESTHAILVRVTFKLIFAPEPDLFEQRLNRFMAELGEDIVIAQLQFSTVLQNGGEVMYSALIGFKSSIAVAAGCQPCTT